MAINTAVEHHFLYSKTQIWKMLFAMAFLYLMVVFLLWRGPDADTGRRDSQLGFYCAIFLALVLPIVTWTIVKVWLRLRTFGDNPVLVVSPDGIRDERSLEKVISWNDVSNVTVKKGLFGKRKSVVLLLKKSNVLEIRPEQLLMRHLSYGNPQHTVTSAWLRTSVAKLDQVLSAFWREYGHEAGGNRFR